MPTNLDKLAERVERAESLLRYALGAIDTCRSEPLFAARDAIRNYFDGRAQDGETR